MLFLLGTIFPASSYAQTTGTLILSNKYDQHYLSPYLTVYNEVPENVDVRELIMGVSKQKKVFSLSNSIYLFNNPKSISWMSFKVKNASETEQWVFDFEKVLSGRFGLFKNVEIYHYNLTTGKIVQLPDKVAEHTSIKLTKGASAQIFLKFSKVSTIPASVSMRLVKLDTLVDEKTAANISFAPFLLVGFIFGLLGFYFSSKNTTAIALSGYYLIFSILYFIQAGVFQSPYWILNSALYPIFFIFLGLAAITASWFFWRISTKTELVHKAYLIWTVLIVILPLIGMVFTSSNLFIFTLFCFTPTLLSLIAICLISVFLSQNEDQGNIFYMLAWFVFIMGLSITIFSLSSVIQPISVFLNAHYYALIPQFIFFMLALYKNVHDQEDTFSYSNTLQINEDESINKLRETKENNEQQRLLKVIEQERKVMGELRKSEARRAEEMRVSKEAADEANRSKSAFLAVVSHEIRTPMTGIMGMVRLLLNGNLSKEQKEQAQTIQDSSDAMLALLNDILDFEKIEQGKMTFENISFDLPRLFRGVINLMNGHASQKNVTLEAKLDSDLPRYVRGDMARLRQVLLNLIGNAIKFTDQGSVTVTAKMMQAPKGEDGTYEIYFGVKDSGIGISETAQQNLFNPFAQADSSISRKFGGTGLGLAISRGLVEGMGSTINISSNEGEGSTFFFTLSMQKGFGNEADKVEEETRKKLEVSQQSTPDLTILVVDDNMVNQSVISGFLNDKPYTIDTAGSAEEALYKLEQKTYDILLMDIELPGMNGDEATQKIREGNDNIKNIPVIALTGNMMPDDIEQYKNAGMNDVLAKPIDSEQLNYVILNLTNSKASKETPGKEAVEPTETITNIVKQETIDEPSIELEVDQPVSLELEGEDTLSDVVAPEPQIPAEVDASDQPQTEVAEPDAPISGDAFNPDTLNTLKGHLSAEDLEVMVNDVIVKSEEIIADIQKALAVEDIKLLSSKGHELKGMAGNFGLIQLSAVASDIESKAKSEQPPIVISSLVEQLPDALNNSKQATEEWIKDNS